MINFEFRPKSYFDGSQPSTLLAKLSYPESQWGEDILLYVNLIDGVYFFEAIDFYGNEIYLKPEKSINLLTLQEMIFMIESMDSKNNGQGNISLTLSGIPEVESKIYPELKAYFNEKRKSFGFD
jgi:hypothetical protein